MIKLRNKRLKTEKKTRKIQKGSEIWQKYTIIQEMSKEGNNKRNIIQIKD